MFANDIKVQKWAQKNDIENLKNLFSISKVKKASKQQEKAVKKLSISMTSICYKYIHVCLLKIMHYLKEKINLLNNIFL